MKTIKIIVVDFVSLQYCKGKQDLQTKGQFLPTAPRTLSTDAVNYPDTTPSTQKHLLKYVTFTMVHTTLPTPLHNGHCVGVGDCTIHKPMNECTNIFLMNLMNSYFFAFEFLFMTDANV